MEEYLSYYHPGRGSIPLHVGIIPDGGRRWAIKHNVSLTESYNKSKELIEEFACFFFARGVEQISIYLSSMQNYRRSEEEINSFTEVTKSGLQNEMIKLANRLKVRINVVGNREIIDQDLLTTIDYCQTQTYPYRNGLINFCIAYNPIEEVIDAMRNVKQKEMFVQKLWVRKPVSMIIRTGGANLLSNFLPLQSGFARVYFFDELFNDLTLEEVETTFTKFTQIKRKYGE